MPVGSINRYHIWRCTHCRWKSARFHGDVIAKYEKCPKCGHSVKLSSGQNNPLDFFFARKK